MDGKPGSSALQGFSARGTQIEFQRWELVRRACGLHGKGTPSV